jgi:hypothetical protein
MAFATTRWATGNLIPAIVTHLSVDLLAGYVAPAYFAKQIVSPEHKEAEVAAVGHEEARR